MSTHPEGSGGARGGLARLEPPQWILAGLGAVLVVTAVVEVLGDGLVWIYLVHLVAGLVALVAAPRRGAVKLAALLLGVVFVVLYVVEAAAPGLVGDEPDPSTNASLILTGLVLIAVLVAFMWPLRGTGER